MTVARGTPPAGGDQPPAGTGPGGAGAPPRARVGGWRPGGRSAPLPYALLLPAAVALAVAMGYPLVRQVVMSFQEYGLAQQFGRPPVWVGLDNYRALLTDGYLWTVAARSVLFCAVNAATTMALGVLVALLLTRLSTPWRVLVQVGLLERDGLPVVGVESARKVLDPTLPSNELITQGR